MNAFLQRWRISVIVVSFSVVSWVSDDDFLLVLALLVGLATMTFGKLKSMVFTSKKVSLRVKTNFYN